MLFNIRKENANKIEIAVAKNRYDQHLVNKSFSVYDFDEMLKNPKHSSKTLAEYKESKDSNCKDFGGFILGKLSDGKRKNASVMYRTGMALDLDDAEIGTAEKVMSLSTNTIFIYSTFSSTKLNPRYRIIIPFSRPVTPEEYEPLCRAIAKKIGVLDMVDRSCYVLAQLQFFPSIPRNSQEYEYYSEISNPLNPDDYLSQLNYKDIYSWDYGKLDKVPVKKEPKVKQIKQSSNKTQNSRKKRSPIDVSNMKRANEKPGFIGAFNRAYSIKDAIETFLPDTYVQFCDDRYTYAKSESGTEGGLAIFDDYCFSYHSTDPAHTGHLLTAYDLVKIHLFETRLSEENSNQDLNELAIQKMNELCSKDEKVKNQTNGLKSKRKHLSLHRVIIKQEVEESKSEIKPETVKDNSLENKENHNEDVIKKETSGGKVMKDLNEVILKKSLLRTMQLINICDDDYAYTYKCLRYKVEFVMNWGKEQVRKAGVIPKIGTDLRSIYDEKYFKFDDNDFFQEYMNVYIYFKFFTKEMNKVVSLMPCLSEMNNSYEMISNCVLEIANYYAENNVKTYTTKSGKTHYYFDDEDIKNLSLMLEIDEMDLKKLLCPNSKNMKIFNIPTGKVAFNIVIRFFEVKILKALDKLKSEKNKEYSNQKRNLEQITTKEELEKQIEKKVNNSFYPTIDERYTVIDNAVEVVKNVKKNKDFESYKNMFRFYLKLDNQYVNMNISIQDMIQEIYGAYAKRKLLGVEFDINTKEIPNFNTLDRRLASQQVGISVKRLNELYCLKRKPTEREMFQIIRFYVLLNRFRN